MNALDETLAAVSHELTSTRDGFAVIRNDWWAGRLTVVGYCRLPSTAVRAATAMTTSLAEPGVRYEAATLGRADALTVQP